MKILTIAAAFFILHSACYSQQYTLIKKWETDSVFKVPESVLYNKKDNLLYISNIDGKEPWGADGKGSVGRMKTDGTHIMAEWVTGFNAPKGMGLYKGKLYVADITEVVVVNVAAGQIEKRIKVDGAERLNDITIDKKGAVYVSDTKGKKVFKIVNDKATLLLDSLKGPNGVLAHKNKLYLLDAGSLYRVNNDKSLFKIADGMETSTDGVEVINGKDFIVSSWVGVVYYVAANGAKQVLLDGKDAKINSADIGINAKLKMVYVPTFWRNTVAAYQVK